MSGKVRHEEQGLAAEGPANALQWEGGPGGPEHRDPGQSGCTEGGQRSGPGQPPRASQATLTGFWFIWSMEAKMIYDA